MIYIVAAKAKNGIIGKENSMPWRLPGDLAYFKKLTLGHTVIMGRKTFESMGKPLPGRKNVILTRNQDYRAEGCIVVHSMEDALRQSHGEDAFIIGGAEIYSKFMNLAHRLYITLIDEVFDGDTHFPPIDSQKWHLTSSVKGPKDEKNPYDYYFQIYESTTI